MDLRMTVLRPHLAGASVDVRISVEPGTPLREVHSDLLALVGAGAAHRLRHDGEELDPATPLGLPPLLDGALLTVDADTRPGPDRPGPGRSDPSRLQAGPPTVELHVLSGPQSGDAFGLLHGVSRIGRAADQQVRLDDPEVSRQHAELRVGSDGICLRDNGSANGTLVSGRPLAVHRWSPLKIGEPITIGANDLVLREAVGSLAACQPDGAGHLLVNRVPRLTPEFSPPVVRFPDPPPERERLRLSWIGLTLPLLVSIPLALIWRQPAVLALALTGPLAMAGQHAVERRRQRRDGQRRATGHAAALRAAEQSLAEAVVADLADLVESFPHLARVAADAAGPSTDLWRCGLDRDGLQVRVGHGARPARVTMTGGTAPPLPHHEDAPMTLDLTRHRVTALCGPRQAVLGTARALLGQLAVRYPPGELEMTVLTSDARRGPDWAWLGWLPHHRTDLQEPVGPPERHRLVVVDRTTGAGRHQQVAAALATAERADGRTTVLWLDRDELEAPRTCSAVLCCDPAQARLREQDGSAAAVTIEPASLRWATVLARRLAPLCETVVAAEHGLPRSVSWCRLSRTLGADPTDPDEVQRSWARGPTTAVLLGVRGTGRFSIDLRRDGPHALVAGTTGAGKSELLQTWVTGLAVGNRPDQLNLLLVDYKGGAAFAGCLDLPHVAGLLTDLDEHLARRALTSLSAEVKRRERLLRRAGAADLEDYQRRRATAGDHLPGLPRLVIMVDEFRVLVDELPGFIPGLVRIAAVGRSLGIHLVLATQRPGGAVSADIRANVNLRIALRVRDRIESEDVLDSPDAATLDPAAPGRAVARIGPAEPVMFQAARVRAGTASGTAPRVQVIGRGYLAPAEPAGLRSRPGTGRGGGGPHEADDLSRVVAAVAEAAGRCGLGRAAAPWLPALPEQLRLETADQGAARLADQPGGGCPAASCTAAGSEQRRTALATAGRSAVPLGLVDHPELRLQHLWAWQLARGGNLAIAGGPRTGRSSAIRTLAGAASVPVYVIDGAGTLTDLESLPQVGAVAVAADVERCERLLRLLTSTVHDRLRGAVEADHEPVLLLVDGWEAVADAWAPFDHAAALDRLLRLMRDGPGADVLTAVTGGRTVLSGQPAAQLGQRLVLPMADQADELVAGVPSAMLGRRRVPGRAVWLAPATSDGVEVQLALPADATTAGSHPPRTVPVPVPALPTSIRRSDLDPADADAGLPVGVGGERVSTLALPIRPGAGVVVAGAPGSGRSTTLAVLAEALSDVGMPHLTVDSWDPRAAHLVADRPDTCVLVDGPLPIPAELDDALRRHLHVARQGGHPGSVVLVCEPAQLLTAYSGVLAEARSERTGLLLGSLGPGEAECLGLRLPPRPAGPPGRGLLVVRGRATTIQVASPGRPPAGETMLGRTRSERRAG